MRTNFEHLKDYPEYYETAVSAEKMLLVAKNQAEVKMAGNAMRQVGEGLLKELLRKYQGYANDSFRKNYYSAKNMKILTWDSLNNIDTLIDFGNISSHPESSIIKRHVMMMYEALYEESYKMVNYYLTDKAVHAYQKEKKRIRKERHDAFMASKNAYILKDVKAGSKTPAQSAAKPAAPAQSPVKSAAPAAPRAQVSTPVKEPSTPAMWVAAAPQAKPVATPKKKKNYAGTVIAALIWLWIIGSAISMFMTF